MKAAAGHSALSSVAILMGTRNGEAFLAEQLDSIAAQTHADWRVWASDDGSTDGTLALLESRQRAWAHGRLSILPGPRKGFVANFLSLVCQPEVDGDYFAFSDQDDVWEADKLRRAVEWLGTMPAGVPALYCTRTRLIDAAGKPIGYSPLFKKPPDFRNALVQSIGGANTMVFNRAARDLLREAGADVNVSSHDCWAYLAVSACGGRVRHDPTPTLRYRQHGGNLVGANTGWPARMLRLRMLLGGYLKDWNDRHIDALQILRSQMTPENRKILEGYAAARKNWLFPRMLGVLRAGTYRQTALDNLALALAAIFKKI